MPKTIIEWIDDFCKIKNKKISSILKRQLMTEFEEVSERYEEKDLARLIGKPIIGPKLNLLALESRVSNTYP